MVGLQSANDMDVRLRNGETPPRKLLGEPAGVGDDRFQVPFIRLLEFSIEDLAEFPDLGGETKGIDRFFSKAGRGHDFVPVRRLDCQTFINSRRYK